MPSRALLTEVQTISNAEIVQALANVKIVATSGITSTFPATASTLAGLSVANTFTANQAFSGTISIVATTSTAGQILQAGTQFIHTYGTDNLFLGAAGNATLTNMSGSGLNLAIGKLALSGATTTSGNVAIGKGALRLITTSASNNNVVIGNQCADNTADLIETIAIGTNCQRSIASNSATAIGVSANCGSFSVAIGHQALNGTTAGAVACTAVGRRSLLLATGERNTACGHEAGSTITSGTYNTLLGDSAQTGSATGTYRTAIGSGATANINNSIKLGRDILDVVVLPKMTTAQRGTYGTPVGGALIFNTSTGKLNFWNSTAGTPAWEEVTSV